MRKREGALIKRKAGQKGSSCMRKSTCLIANGRVNVMSSLGRINGPLQVHAQGLPSLQIFS